MLDIWLKLVLNWNHDLNMLSLKDSVTWFFTEGMFKPIWTLYTSYICKFGIKFAAIIAKICKCEKSFIDFLVLFFSWFNLNPLGLMIPEWEFFYIEFQGFEGMFGGFLIIFKHANSMVSRTSESGFLFIVYTGEPTSAVLLTQWHFTRKLASCQDRMIS